MSDDLAILRVQDPALFDASPSADPVETHAKQALAELVARAFHGEPFASAEDAAAWLAENAADPAVAVCVARRPHGFVGLAIVTAWTSCFSPHPWVAHFYAPNDRDARHALARWIADWCRNRGHRKVSAVNASGKPDAVWLSAFKPVAEGTVVASYVEFDIGGA